MRQMNPSMCEGGIDVGLLGTGSAVNGWWRPGSYTPIERTPGNGRGERRKTRGMIEMRQVRWETCLLRLFSYLN